MYLGNYIKNLNKKYYKNNFFQVLLLIVQKVKKNNIFFALKGNKFDGNKFIPMMQLKKVLK